MQYSDSFGKLDTAKKILKVDHAGEFGAINIYRAQIVISKLFNRPYISLLEKFLDDEKKHMNIFWEEIQKRNGVKCKSFWLCGLGGYAMGTISALLGKRGIMACTYAVESVVTSHLEEQLIYLKSINDQQAFKAVKSILEDEQHHRDTGINEGGDSLLYKPFRFVIRLFTEGVIHFGMR